MKPCGCHWSHYSSLTSSKARSAETQLLLRRAIRRPSHGGEHAPPCGNTVPLPARKHGYSSGVRGVRSGAPAMEGSMRRTERARDARARNLIVAARICEGRYMLNVRSG